MEKQKPIKSIRIPPAAKAIAEPNGPIAVTHPTPIIAPKARQKKPILPISFFSVDL
jgi:hypothetical protein